MHGRPRFAIPIAAVTALFAPPPAPLQTGPLQNGTLQNGAPAPDGRRGFGEPPRSAELRRLFRAAKGEDARFLAGIFALPPRVDVLASLAAARYERLGYFALLEGDPGARLRLDLTALHRRFEVLSGRPFLEPLSPAEARAFLHMVLDLRFRVRMGVLEGRQRDLRHLRGALALFTAHAHGLAELADGEELRTLAAQADLAAARLRAIALDLEALYEPAAGASVAADPPAVGELLPYLVHADPGPRARLQGLQGEARLAARRWTESLFTRRFDRRFGAALEARQRAEDRARRIHREMLRLIPSTDQGRGAAEFADWKDLERYRRAAESGSEGLRLDPLNPSIHYLRAVALDYFAGQPASTTHFDRFLALRGIRHWDHRTFSGRLLDPMEEYALLRVVGWRPPDRGREKD